MTASEFTILPATAEDIAAFRSQPLLFSVRAYAVFRGDELVAVAGVRMEPGHFACFSDIKPGVSAPAITVFRLARAIVTKLQGLHLPVVAHTTTSDRFLIALGFALLSEAADGNYYYLNER